jgi:hypothetical protein
MPVTVTEVRSFLGLAGYYCRFIEGFSKIVKPVTELLKKNHKFVWTEDCGNSFMELKTRLTTAPVLTLPNIHKSFYICCDASKHGIGFVLMQEGTTRKNTTSSVGFLHTSSAVSRATAKAL